MNYYVIAANVSLTLMILQKDGNFAPSTVMTYPYFILADESFAANAVENCKQLFYQIYDEHCERLKLREPNDPNYIAVVDVEPKNLTSDELAAQPWLAARVPSWEDSNCIVVQNNRLQKVEPNRFSGILGVSN